MLQELILSSLPYVPQPIMRRLAARYIAGETLQEALDRLHELSRQGHPGILDILGEEVASEAEARSAAASYMEATRCIVDAGLDASISIKPTHLGLLHSEELAFELFDGLARHCSECGQFLRVEMEDHSTTDATLRLFERLRRRFENIGIVLQARLLRTPGDIDALAAGPLNVRICKGVYLESEQIAHVEAEHIREAFLNCTAKLIERGARVCLATHDAELAARSIALLREREHTDYEFQVLLGVQRQLWKQWCEAGHSVRVYVPYGPEWRAYSTRRLRKNPEILRHVIRDTLRLGR